MTQTMSFKDIQTSSFTHGTLNLDCPCRIPLCDRKWIWASSSSRSRTFPVNSFQSDTAATTSLTFRSMLIERTVVFSSSPTNVLALDSLLTERLSYFSCVFTKTITPRICLEIMDKIVTSISSVADLNHI